MGRRPKPRPRGGRPEGGLWGATGYAQWVDDEPPAWEGGWNYDGDLRPWVRQPDRRYGGMGGGRGYGRTDWGMRKLKMPMFDGEDPYDWVYRAERYFSVLGMTEDEKMHAAPICLEGRALAWFQWVEERQNIRGWLEFRDLLLDRFKVIQEGSHHNSFSP